MRAPDVIGEFSTRLSHGLMNSQHPRQFGYFTPPPLPMSIMGELLAQVANQGVDVWHAGPFAAFVEEEVVRWLCDLVGYGEGVVRPADERRGHGQLHGHGARPRPAPRSVCAGCPARRAARTSRVPASTRATRRTSRSPARSTSSGSRPTRWSCLPADDEFHLRGAPVAAAIRRDRAAGLTPFAIAAVAGSTNTGSVDAIGELADVADDRGTVAARRCGVRRRRAPVGARSRPGHGPAIGRTSVTVDPHKWFFQAYDIGGLLVRDGRMLRAVFGGRAPEYYRGGETSGTAAPDDLRDGEPDDGHERRRPAQLLQAVVRGDPPLARAEAVDDVEAPRDAGLREAHRGQRRSRRVPRAPLRGGRRLRGPAGGPGAVGRVLPARPDRARRRSARCPPGSPPGSARTIGRRLAHHDATAWVDLAARRGRSTTSRPRRTSTSCSKRSRTLADDDVTPRLERGGPLDPRCDGLGPARRGGLLEGEQHVEDVVGELAARAMRPVRAGSRRPCPPGRCPVRHRTGIATGRPPRSRSRSAGSGPPRRTDSGRRG